MITNLYLWYISTWAPDWPADHALWPLVLKELYAMYSGVEAELVPAMLVKYQDKPRTLFKELLAKYWAKVRREICDAWEAEHDAPSFWGRLEAAPSP